MLFLNELDTKMIYILNCFRSIYHSISFLSSLWIVICMLVWSDADLSGPNRNCPLIESLLGLHHWTGPICIIINFFFYCYDQCDLGSSQVKSKCWIKVIRNQLQTLSLHWTWMSEVYTSFADNLFTIHLGKSICIIYHFRVIFFFPFSSFFPLSG